MSANVDRPEGSMPALDVEIFEFRMRDSYGGYDWGDPVVLWTVRAPRVEFTAEQLLVAERVLGVSS